MMNYITRRKPPPPPPPFYSYPHLKSLTKVPLKWVKNRCIDHFIRIHTDLKSVSILSNAILRSPTGSLTSAILNDAQWLLGLTYPTVRFLRRYPTLFEEYPHPKYQSLRCFKVTEVGKRFHEKEGKVFEMCKGGAVERVCRLLMMTQSKMVPLKTLLPLKWDLGLPDDFDKNLVTKFPDYLQVVEGTSGLPYLKLVKWRDELAVSELEKMNEKELADEFDSAGDRRDGLYTDFKKGKAALQFPLSFPRGYGERTKVKAWMNDFHKLPYISPYEDSGAIDPNSDLMEKRVVGLLHEFLSLTLYKKTKNSNLKSLREELNLPRRFTRVFNRYPGIFYLSRMCNTTTVALKEGYHRGKLVIPSRHTRQRQKLYYEMRNGAYYRNRTKNILPQLETSENNDEQTVDEVESGEEEEGGEEEGGEEEGDEDGEEEYEMTADSSEEETLEGENI